MVSGVSVVSWSRFGGFSVNVLVVVVVVVRSCSFWWCKVVLGPCFIGVLLMFCLCLALGLGACMCVALA